MEDYNSKRTGEQIEALLDIVAQGGSGGGGEGEVQKTTEAEIIAMGFTKNLGTITGITMNGANKGTSGVVDLGKVITEHQDISGKVDKVTGKGLSTEDFTSALKTKLENLSNYDDTALSNALTTLRGDFDKLVSGDTTTAIKTFNEVIAFLEGISDSEDLDSIIAGIEQQISGKQDVISDLATIRSNSEWTDRLKLAIQPYEFESAKAIEIPSGLILDSDTAYALPTSGYIDVADDVLLTRRRVKTINGESIYGEGDIVISGGGSGTITEVQANGTSVSKSGVANIPAATTSAYGVTKLTSSTSSTSTTLAATASAVKSAYDLANSYKGTVTGVKINGSTKSPSSGTVDIGNVVTSVKVNGSTYSPSSGVVDLGTISGGGSSSGGDSYAGNYPVQVVSQPLVDITLQPNVFYRNSQASLSAVKIKLASPTNQNIVNEYLFEWYQAGICSVSLPSSVVWANDDMPDFEEKYTYVLSIVDNIAICTKTAGNVIGAQGGGGGSDD